PEVAALQADHARLRSLQAEDGPQQHGFAGARAAHDAENFVLEHLHVELVVHHLGTEAIHDAARLDHRTPCGHQMSSSRKSTANSASARMTRKIDCTTATVVRRPSSREESRTCMPRYTPAMAISMANTGALMMPTQKVVGAIESFTRSRYCVSGMSS